MSRRHYIWVSLVFGVAGAVMLISGTGDYVIDRHGIHDTHLNSAIAARLVGALELVFATWLFARGRRVQ